MKDSIQCPNCHNNVPDLPYCTKCGFKIREEDSEQKISPNKLICPQCKRENPEDYKFCTFCRKQLDSISNADLNEDFKGFKVSSENIDWHNKKKVNIRDIRTTHLPIFSETLKIGHFSFKAPSKSSMNIFTQQFGSGNLLHYMISFIFVFFIYSFWYTCWFLFDKKIFGLFDFLLQSKTLVIPSEPLLVILELILISSLLFFLTFSPILFSTFYILKRSQILVLFKVNSRILLFSSLFGLFAPLLIPPGILTLREREFSLSTRNLQKTVALAAIMQVITTGSLLILALLGGFFPDTFFGDFQEKFLLIYNFSVWICVFTIIPWLSPYGKLLQQWNSRLFWLLVILCGVFILFFFVPFDLLNYM